MAELYTREDSPYWWAWGYEADGKTRWHKSTKVKRQTKLRRRAQRVAENIERERVLGTTPALYLEEALEALRQKKIRDEAADDTLEILRDKGRRLVEFFGPIFDLQRLTLEQTENYMSKRMQGDKVSASTVEKEIRELLAALALAKRHGKWDGDAKTLKPDGLKNVGTERTRRLDDDELAAIWPHVLPQWRDHFMAYIYTGVRYSELYKIEASDVDLKTGTVMIYGTKTKRAKTGRAIPIHPAFAPVLKARCEKHTSGPIFPDRWENSPANRQLKKWARAAGINDDLCVTDLRRTFCSMLGDRGVPEFQVIAMMGHTSSRMVRTVYMRLSTRSAAAWIEKLPNVTTMVREEPQHEKSENSENKKRLYVV